MADAPASCKIFVGNVAYDTTQKDMEETFGKFGDIKEVQLKKGFGFIDYVDEQNAQDAIDAMDGQEFKGRVLKVEVSKPAPAAPGPEEEKGPTRHLFFANVPRSVTLPELREYFEKYGKVEKVVYLPNRGQNPLLSGFVDFEDIDSAVKAFSTPHNFSGETLRLDYNERRPPRTRGRQGAGGRGGRPSGSPPPRDIPSERLLGDRPRAPAQRGYAGRGRSPPRDLDRSARYGGPPPRRDEDMPRRYLDSGSGRESDSQYSDRMHDRYDDPSRGRPREMRRSPRRDSPRGLGRRSRSRSRDFGMQDSRMLNPRDGPRVAYSPPRNGVGRLPPGPANGRDSRRIENDRDRRGFAREAIDRPGRLSRPIYRGPPDVQDDRGFGRERPMDRPRDFDRPRAYEGARDFDRPRDYEDARAYGRPGHFERSREYNGPRGVQEHPRDLPRRRDLGGTPPYGDGTNPRDRSPYAQDERIARPFGGPRGDRAKEYGGPREAVYDGRRGLPDSEFRRKDFREPPYERADPRDGRRFPPGPDVRDRRPSFDDHPIIRGRPVRDMREGPRRDDLPYGRGPPGVPMRRHSRSRSPHPRNPGPGGPIRRRSRSRSMSPRRQVPYSR